VYPEYGCKFGKRPPNTSDPIQVSSSPSDHKNPHKKLKESSTRESKHIVKIDSEPIMPNILQESTVTPSPKTLYLPQSVTFHPHQPLSPFHPLL
jgi:hypothetical protein